MLQIRDVPDDHPEKSGRPLPQRFYAVYQPLHDRHAEVEEHGRRRGDAEDLFYLPQEKPDQIPETIDQELTEAVDPRPKALYDRVARLFRFRDHLGRPCRPGRREIV